MHNNNNGIAQLCCIRLTVCYVDWSQNKLCIDREKPLGEAIVAAEQPVATQRIPPVSAAGGLPEGYRLLPFPAGARHAGGQAGVWVTGRGGPGRGEETSARDEYSSSDQCNELLDSSLNKSGLKSPSEGQLAGSQ